MHALLVDDSRAIRAIIGRTLRELGFTTLEASDGKDALAKLTATGATRPDLALVDWNMPVMNGIDLVKEVRARPEFAGMKIVMCTTETDVEQVEQALGAGADEYIMKPFTRDAIVAKLQIIGLLPS